MEFCESERGYLTWLSGAGQASVVRSATAVEDIADHIDHAVKVAGIDHVEIGSDFDGIAATANGLEDVSKMPALVAVLLNRAYAERDLKKILGENTLRVVAKLPASRADPWLKAQRSRVQEVLDSRPRRANRPRRLTSKPAKRYLFSEVHDYGDITKCSNAA